MKNALLAAACTLGVVACGGETKPADSPTQATTSTTVTTTSGTRATPDITTPTPAQGQTSVPARTAPQPAIQGGGKDRDITAAIRRSVVADSSLSWNAKNVKIITVAGKVTLRGPVKSDAEKATIEAKTKAAAGVTEVDNQLEVKK